MADKFKPALETLDTLRDKYAAIESAIGWKDTQRIRVAINQLRDNLARAAGLPDAPEPYETDEYADTARYLCRPF